MTTIPVSGSQETSHETFYCQVDTHVATKDYLKHGRCVRLIGVRPDEFTDSALEEGVSTVTIDLDYWDFCSSNPGLGWPARLRRKKCELVDRRDGDPRYRNTWYRLDVKFSERGTGYLYPTFSNEKERYFTIQSLTQSDEQPVLPQFGIESANGLDQSLAGSKSNGRRFVFDTFHVGQGMCSLVHNGSQGVLLDAGAGKPVTRKAYLEKTIQSDLDGIVEGLSEVIAVISHADIDHWRLLVGTASCSRKYQRFVFPLAPNP